MRILHQIRKTIPDFDFHNCQRILRLVLFEEDNSLSLEATFLCKEWEVVVVSYEVEKVSIPIEGRRMWLGELLISKGEDCRFIVHDELLGLRWTCEGFELVKVVASAAPGV